MTQRRGNEFTHSTRLVLVDRQGRIRGFYEGRTTNDRGEPVGEFAQLKAALALVQREGRFDFPEINAGLNALCALMLVTGWLAIRRGHVRLHVTCMISALFVSAAFLGSYLYYHFAIRQGRPTPFTHGGLARTVYFAVLLSHTVLATVVPPMALYTAYLAVRCRFGRHVRWARWTLPIWLYVSVTGVIVYWMLYQAFPPD